MADTYRTIIGVVQFDPREGKAGGKDVRNITVRQTGVKDQAIYVGATLWPSHAAVQVERGDAVVLEGKFSRSEGLTNDGEKRTYNNLSVTGIRVLGGLNTGVPVDVAGAADDASTDDDIPY